jgi:hypothetical protein
MCFDVENECTKKKFQECHMKDFFDQKHTKNLFFGNFFWMLIFENNSNANLNYVFFVDN